MEERSNLHKWSVGQGAKYFAVVEQIDKNSPEQIWSGDGTCVQNVLAVSNILY